MSTLHTYIPSSPKIKNQDQTLEVDLGYLTHVNSIALETPKQVIYICELTRVAVLVASMAMNHVLMMCALMNGEGTTSKVESWLSQI